MTNSIEAAYSRLNDYLIENVDNEEISANLEAAFKYLKEQDGVKHLGVHSIFSRTPVEDLKKFTALQQVIGDVKCDDYEYEVILGNEAEVGLYALKEDQKVVRRIDKVMLKIFIYHAEKCQDVYPKRYRAKREQFDKVALERVKDLTRVIMDFDDHNDDFESSSRRSRFFYTSDNLFSKYIRTLPSIHLYSREGILRNALKASGMYDPNLKYVSKFPDERTGKSIVHKEEIKRLVEEYIIKPCQNYVASFGPDLFIPARLDSRFYSKIDNIKSDYYLGWSIFMICQSLTKNEAFVHSSLIKSAQEDIKYRY